MPNTLALCQRRTLDISRCHRFGTLPWRFTYSHWSGGYATFCAPDRLTLHIILTGNAFNRSAAGPCSNANPRDRRTYCQLPIGCRKGGLNPHSGFQGTSTRSTKPKRPSFPNGWIAMTPRWVIRLRGPRIRVGRKQWSTFVGYSESPLVPCKVYRWLLVDPSDHCPSSFPNPSSLYWQSICIPSRTSHRHICVSTFFRHPR